MSEQKRWSKPCLIVLTRGVVEERVLCVCKAYGVTSGPYGAYSACMQKRNYYSSCQNCSGMASS